MKIPNNTMNRFFSKLKKEARHIRLTMSEREVMLHTLEQSMQGTALMKSPIRITPWPGRPSPFMFFAPRMMQACAVVLVLVMVGGSTAYAAEGALPGELLYPFKVNVNERVATAFATSPEKQAEVHTRLAERRMQEAEELTAHGGMTAETKDILTRRFEKHAQEVERITASVEETDSIAAADISARFESTIEAHSAVIERLSRGSESRENRDEASRFALALLEERGRTRAAALSSQAATMAKMEVEERDNEAEMENADAITQDTARVAFAPASPMIDEEVRAITRIAQNASTTLREIEAHFLVLEAQLEATTSASTEAQISRLRARIEALLNGSTDVSLGRERAQKAFKDAVRLRTFLEVQDKFREQVILPAPDDGEEGGEEERAEEEAADESQKGEEDVLEEDTLTFPIERPVSL